MGESAHGISKVVIIVVIVFDGFFTPLLGAAKLLSASIVNIGGCVLPIVS